MRRGLFTFWIIFAIILIILLFLFYLIIPLLQQMQVHTINSAIDIIKTSNITSLQIKNETIKSQIINATNEELNSLVEQHSILSTFIKYSWILIIILSILCVYILARQSVETSMIR